MHTHESQEIPVVKSNLCKVIAQGWTESSNRRFESEEVEHKDYTPGEMLQLLTKTNPDFLDFKFISFKICCTNQFIRVIDGVTVANAPL